MKKELYKSMGLLLNKPSVCSMKDHKPGKKRKWKTVRLKIPRAHTGLGEVHVLTSKNEEPLLAMWDIQ